MIKKFVRAMTPPQRQPQGHDFSPGVSSLYPPGTYKDFYKLETSYPSAHPEYTEQTDRYTNSIPASLPRSLSEEQAFQLLNRKYNITREQFEKMKTKRANIIDQMVEQIKGTQTVSDLLEDENKDETVDIELKELGNGALAETLPDGTILINDSIEEVDDLVASRLVHELSHFFDWKDESYIDRPEEQKAFQNQIKFLLEKGYSQDEIKDLLLPIFTEYKDKTESEDMIEEMIDNSTSQLKTAKTTKINLTFSPEEKALLDKVALAGEKLGIKVFLAGGLIRDRLLGKPNSDLDFVTNKNSEQLAAYLAKQYGLNQPIKMDRSGATMLYMDGRYLDIIDAKKVFSFVGQGAPASLEQGEEGEMAIMFDDSFRRDLTINSLMYSLDGGKLYDPTGKGLFDVQNRIIRTIIPPEIKYRAQPADMLRALRFFATKEGFKFAPGMLKAMKENVHRLLPRQRQGDISSRRIERELRKADSPEAWSKMKAALAEIGANKYITDEIKAVEQDKEGGIEYNLNK